jgi:hypothetical protein
VTLKRLFPYPRITPLRLANEREGSGREMPELGIKMLRMCVSKGRSTLLRRALAQRPTDVALLDPCLWGPACEF